MSRPVGRPTKYTPDLGGKIVAAVSRLDSKTLAAAAVGISMSTLTLWLRNGARKIEEIGEPGPEVSLSKPADEREFSAAIARVSAAAELTFANVIYTRALKDPNWAKQFLQMHPHFRRRWGERVREEQEADFGDTPRFDLSRFSDEELATYEALLEKARVREEGAE